MSRLTPIYAIESISQFAGSLVGIFIPIYLLTVGYNVRDVMIFSLMQVVAGTLAILFTAWLSHRVQLRLIMIARIPVLVTFLALLAAARHHPVPLMLLAALQGLQFVLYYLPLHVFFTLGSTEQTIGRQLGLLSAIPKIVGIGAPLLAGIIAASRGFNAVFALAAVIYALSAAPMSALSPEVAPFSLSLSGFRRLYSRYRTYFWLEIIENIQEELDLVIWPLVVYLTVKNTVQAGAASTLIAAGSALFTYLIGHRADRNDKFRLLRLGGLAMMLLWLWRLGPLTPWTVFVISALVGFAGVLISIPFNSIIYNLARINDPRRFIIFREVPIGIARFIVYSIAVLVATDLTHLFWMAIAAYAVFALIPRFQLKEAPAGSR